MVPSASHSILVKFREAYKDSRGVNNSISKPVIEASFSIDICCNSASIHGGKAFVHDYSFKEFIRVFISIEYL